MEESRPIRKLHRLKGYDYSQNGAYFVTICTKNRAPLLCRVGNAVLGVPPPVIPSPIGTLVLAAWEKLGRLDPGIRTDAFCLMPNHIHGIIMLDEGSRASDAERRGRRSLPEIIRGFKSVTTCEYNRLVPPEKKNMLWQSSYYDTVLRSEAHYLAVRQYIDGNSARWTEDEYYPSQLHT